MQVKKSRLASILEAGGFVMTELRRTNNVVGVLRAEREFFELRSCVFVSVLHVSRAAASAMTEAPPL